MKKSQLSQFLVTLIITLFAASAFGGEQILHPYQSARSLGMGGVKITTGLYDDNFFGNPARVMANPRTKVTILDPAIELNPTSISTFGDLLGNKDQLVEKLGSTGGKNNHARVQTTFPSVYIAAKEDGKMAFAFGLITSTQADVRLSNNYQFDPSSIIDAAAVVTIGRRFFEDNRLSVGVNGKVAYRAAVQPGYSFIDIIRGRTLSLSNTGAQGGMINFDIGGTYILPVEPLGFKLTPGMAINNVLGGNYSMDMSFVSGVTAKPPRQPAALGLGISASKETLGPFSNFIVALEAYDIGNNLNGSIFRTIHFGGEAHWSVLTPRLGFNQGYISAGLGIDLRILQLDLATYGEEMSLNVGQQQDRRFAFRFALQI